MSEVAAVWNLRRARLSIIILGFVSLVLEASSASAVQKNKKNIPDVVIFFDNGSTPNSEKTMRFGLIVTTTKDPKTPTGYKQLTWHPQGITSNVCARIDGKNYLLGHPPGKWLEREGRLGNDNAGNPRLGRKSTFLFPDRIEVIQTVEIVRGPLTGRMDTCRVHYQITNKDNKRHKVGLRFLLDTYIGSNDGAPFLVPRQNSLCETQREFNGAKNVPAFVGALEKFQLNDPGIIAHLNPAPESNLERPVRLTLGAWPDARSKIPGAKDGLTLWNVPVFPIDKMDDSAAVIYWAETTMKPDNRREMGFTYGLGKFTGEEKGKLGLFLSGKPKVDEEMTVVALARKPAKGQKVTLKTGKKYEITKGSPHQNVPEPAADSYQISPVTWKVRLTEPGEVVFRVESSTGVSHQQSIAVQIKDKR